jgi:hypothetical protein
MGEQPSVCGKVLSPHMRELHAPPSTAVDAYLVVQPPHHGQKLTPMNRRQSSPITIYALPFR